MEANASDFETTSRLCSQNQPPLWPGDALHLAICQRQRSCLVSVDEELCLPAEHYSVAVVIQQATDREKLWVND